MIYCLLSRTGVRVSRLYLGASEIRCQRTLRVSGCMYPRLCRRPSADRRLHISHLRDQQRIFGGPML